MLLQAFGWPLHRASRNHSTDLGYLKPRTRAVIGLDIAIGCTGNMDCERSLMGYPATVRGKADLAFCQPKDCRQMSKGMADR
jgi:hypothetical protein